MSDLRLEDIARQAGVSRSTVSRVVKDQPHVREDVRQRVLKVIQSTGDHPNVAARALASQRSWMIGLVLPRSVSSFFADPYFPRLTQGPFLVMTVAEFVLFAISSSEKPGLTGKEINKVSLSGLKKYTRFPQGLTDEQFKGVLEGQVREKVGRPVGLLTSLPGSLTGHLLNVFQL